MRQSCFAWALLVTSIGISACELPREGEGDPDAAGRDAGSDIDAGAGSVCELDRDCDDGLFCNGVERCSPEAAGADDEGCIAGRGPCGAGTRCDEEGDQCVPCDVDADGDGVRAIECGGADCDDDDGDRFPGNAEVCDAEGHDEDCDPATFGALDADGDGAESAACCDASGAGAPVCGTDCDDTAAGVSPRATEACNGVDDDCDGATDEGVLVSLFRDDDLDGFATRDPAATPMLACAPSEGWVIARGDCDDAAAGVNPGVPDVCNAIDDDCDGLTDDVTPGVVACVSGSSRPCVTACGVAGTASCRADCLGLEACVGAEACNGCDDDADGARDEDFECERGFPVGCTTACGTQGTRQCSTECTLGACVAAERCNYCDDDGINGFADERVLASDGETAYGIRGGGAAFGAASEDVTPPGAGGEFTIFAQLLDGTSVTQAGTYWIDLDKYVGWGPVRFDVRLEAERLAGGIPMGGWSLVVANGGTGDLGTPQDLGVPRTLTGVRFDWHWSNLTPPFQTPDDVDMGGFRRMVGGGFAPRGQTGCPLAACRNDGLVDSIGGGDLNASTSGVVTQRMIIEYQPENPYTTVREERLVITANGQSRTFVADDGIRETTDLQNDLPIGSRLRIGLTAGSYEYTYSTPEGGPFTEGARVRARALLTIFDPPDGPEPPTYTDLMTISRALICPES